MSQDRKGVRIYLYFVGKPRDAHANALASEYLKRAGRWARCEMREVAPGRDDWWSRHAAAMKIVLDAAGHTMDSGAFAELFGRLEREGRDAVFLIGAHDGVPEDWKRRADLLLSLSEMTFPHELARAMLAEQIYRALATLRGHPYPR
jgi:23S rRNA (pseudouridine1915-N3)-methyltransferase